MNSPATRQPNNRSVLQNLFALVSDIRFLQIFGQLIFLVLVFIAVSGTINQIVSALASSNLSPNFAFLQNRAGFAIGGAGDYTPDDSYWEAFLVGVRNTLTVVVAGLAGATILGIFGGIFLLSGNWLIRNISRFIIEILRNTPLLVQIFTWYFVIVLALPTIQQSIQRPQPGLVALPLRYAIYIIAAFFVLRMRGERRALLMPALVGLITAVEIGFLFFYNTPYPERNLFNAGASTTGAWLYLIVSLGLIVGLRFVGSADLRRTAWGLAIGQFIGGLLFLLGGAPDAAVFAELKPIIVLSNRGLVYPEVHTTARFAEWFLFVVLGITVAGLMWAYLGRLTEQTGDPHPRARYGLVSIVLFAVIGWFVVSAEPLPAAVPVNQDGTVTFMPLEQARASGALTADDELQYSSVPLTIALPERAGLRFSSGITLDPRYIALLAALAIYTAAFIAEIVRAGILAVPHGQIEAARALGLSGSQVLSMVVLPQALRVIIPPLGNQYLNLAKNSSLALAISYSDTFAVLYTVINQSGQSVTGIIIIMVSYLILSLVIAAAMNWINGRFQLVTR
ncbi:MAG: ABC transporter permease subunit [Anaerolineae bacterium]|nr:ABC transporter permease subunit [Anaerolineae bacterium]